MFRPLLLAVAFVAVIHPYAKADLLNFFITPVTEPLGPNPGEIGYRTMSFDAYTYDFFPYDASTGGNPDPATYFSPVPHYDNRLTLGILPVTRTYVDAQGVTHTTTANETVTVGYASGYMESADQGEYIVGEGLYTNAPFYTGTLAFGPGSAAVPTFIPGRYVNSGNPTNVLTITDLTTAATPEPSSIVLAGSGLLSGLGMVFRRRRTES